MFVSAFTKYLWLYHLSESTINIANAAATFYLTNWITLQIAPTSSTVLATCSVFCESGAICFSAMYSGWYWVCTHQMSGGCWTCFAYCSLCVHWSLCAKHGGGVWCMVYGVWCMVYGIWCMVYDVWRMAYDVWCMMYGVWCMAYDVWCMVYDVWCMMYGVRCMVYDVWCMMYGVRCMVYGVRCMVYGVRCMVYDVWCTMYGVWCMMYGVWLSTFVREESKELVTHFFLSCLNTLTFQSN